MNREDRCRKAVHDAWENASGVKDRIERLRKVADGYPDYMTPLADLAATYLEAGDAASAIETYRKIISSKDKFKHVWNNELGKAYLFTGDFAKALRKMEDFEKNGHDWSNGLFIALAHLKRGDRSKFEQKFCSWISEDPAKAFDRSLHEKYINALFGKEDARHIGKIWEGYSRKYLEMEPYRFYCELYEQYHHVSVTGLEDLLGEEYRPPRKLGRSELERLSDEYFELKRTIMFGGAGEADRERWLELKELLFADTISR